MPHGRDSSREQAVSRGQSVHQPSTQRPFRCVVRRTPDIRFLFHSNTGASKFELSLVNFCNRAAKMSPIRQRDRESITLKPLHAITLSNAFTLHAIRQSDGHSKSLPRERRSAWRNRLRNREMGG